MARTTTKARNLRSVKDTGPSSNRCPKHPAFEADYCPTCGTAQPVGQTTALRVNRSTKSVPAAAATAKKATANVAKKAPAKKVPGKVAAKTTRKTPTKTTVPTHPGKTWVVLLEEKGLSQSEAARQMGVAPMTLNRLINGHGIPTAKVCVAFARVIGQDVTKVWNEVAAYELALALTTKTK